MAGLVIGAIGLIVSAAAFIVAVWQIRKTQTAAESAARAAREARDVVSQVTSISDLSQIIGQLDQLKELHRGKEWKRAIDRYSSLLRLLTEARSRVPSACIDEESLKAFTRAIMQLRAMAKEVDVAIEQGTELSGATFNNIIEDFEQPLLERLVDLENALAVAGTGIIEND